MKPDTTPILVTRSSMPPMEEYIKEIEDLWESHWLTNMGAKHKALQAGLKEYLAVPKVDLLVNGHMALEMSIQALGLKGEIITTPFTFASTIHAIVRNGCTPVFCDIREDDYTMDVACLESLITQRTCAILPVHVYGHICDVEAIEEIAQKHNLKVIYDAAHAFGVTYQGRGIGSYGDVSCFSFHATKVFNTIEGGAVCFHDEAFGQTIRDLKNFGIQGMEQVEAIGANAKMNEFAAAMGLCNLRHIDEEIAKRKQVAKRYRSHLEGVPGIQLSPMQEGVETNYAYFPVVFRDDIRDQVYAALEAAGIGARKYFYPIASAYGCYRDRYDVADTPVAARISDSVLTLPMYADLSLADVDRICQIVLHTIQ